MFNTIAHAAIDAVQSSKKKFVGTFVQHEGIAQILNNFVDSQTAYTKAAVDTGITTVTALGSVVANKQFYEQMFDGVKSLTPKKASKKAE